MAPLLLLARDLVVYITGSVTVGYDGSQSFASLGSLWMASTGLNGNRLVNILVIDG